MRALTVRQPWAWAIVHGGKDVENRTRNLAGSYRGPVPPSRSHFEPSAMTPATRTCSTTSDRTRVHRPPLENP